jgi:hypothetical protein
MMKKKKTITHDGFARVLAIDGYDDDDEVDDCVEDDVAAVVITGGYLN